MDCKKWVEEGLLYSSRELNAEMSAQFEKHLESCEFCKSEFDAYNHDKTNFFKQSILEESVNPELDRKITEACTKIPRLSVSSNFFMSFAKKGVLAAVLLVFGFGGGVYVAFNFDNITGNSNKIANGKTNTEIKQAVESSNIQSTPSEQIQDLAQAADTVKRDSSSSKKPVFSSKHLGNSSAIVPVDLQGK